MDFPLNRPGLHDSDLSRVFRYAPQETTVARFLAKDPALLLWPLKSPEDSRAWLKRDMPSIQEDSGIVLILARRAGENTSLFAQLDAGAATFGHAKADTYFKESFNEKNRSYSWPDGKALSTSSGKVRERHDKGGIRGGGRELRQVPFEREVFHEICQAFYVHSSISRAISRADVPLFSRADITITQDSPEGLEHPAIVYICRSANTWANDLALTVTYFPQSNLAFGILFGCTASIEKKVLNRLAETKEYGFHPLLLPGIFAELERERMVEVVESTIDRVEEAIFELDTGSSVTGSSRETSETGHPSGARYVRRTVWLNTTFLRTRLRIWKTQLHKMIEEIEQLSSDQSILAPGAYDKVFGYMEDQHAGQYNHSPVQRTDGLIRDRLRAIVEEFDEMIGDCSMRVDGMTIATQWSQGDTNVDIATAAGRDSSQMRSISLVTMIFLPGTFFATVFSMTFFNWNSENGVVVSGYVWIYFLITVVFTIMTLFLWWYFLVHRQMAARGVSSTSRPGVLERMKLSFRSLTDRSGSNKDLEE